MARPRSALARPGQSLALLRFLVFSLLCVLPALAIQVAPDSPCAKLCIDDSALDVSDPASSTTVNADITCSDADFNTTTAGIKWVSCMTCLQNSTHVQGDESDQAWFLYNLRYQVDYCIFGYPNAAAGSVGSSPCQTSTACLPLQDALLTGVPAMGNGSQYDYCSVDGSVLTSASLKGCLNCISGSGDTDVVTNSLIALEAGCIEQLPPSEAIGLSGSIFAAGTTVSATSATSASAASGSRSSHVATTTIVVVAIVSVLVTAAVAGFGFVCYRKRRGAGHRAAFRSALALKTDALASMESSAPNALGLSLGKPAGGGGGGGGGGGKGPVGGRTTGSIGPVDWHTRFPSTEHISGPIHFHSPSSSTVNPEHLLDRKAASPVAPGLVGGNISRPGSANSARSSVVSSLHEQPGAPATAAGAASAQKKKYKQQFQQAHAGSGHVNTNTNGTAASAAGATASNGTLPAIVESPFPSPAVQGAGAVSSLGMRIHSTDFDKRSDYPMANIVTVPGRTATSTSSAARRHPRLHQLETNLGAGGSAVDTTTPSSAAGLLSYAAVPGTAPSTHYGYSPASYAASQRSSAYQPSPLRSQPASAVSTTPSPSSATAGGSAEHQLRIATRSLAAQKQALEHQQQQAEINQKLAAANVAHNARKQGVYKGWSAMVTQAQQHQQHQSREPAPSQHASTHGSPASASAAYRGGDLLPSASSSRPGSINGIGAATMATRHGGQASSPLAGAGADGAGDMSVTATTAPTAPTALGSEHPARKGKSSPVYPFARHGGAGSEGRSPVETRTIQTHFLPPPQQSRR